MSTQDPMEDAYMKKTKLFLPAVVGGLFVFTLAVPASATETTTPQCQPLSGWDTSETRSAGHLEITTAGLHVWTDDASSQAKVAAYKSPAEGTSLGNIGTPAIEWDGTSPAPGLQLVIDIAGGTGQDGILVGESVYGNNWWLSNGSTDAMKALAPHTGGGNGSNWYGTLAEWKTKTDTVGGGWINKVGFSLGSGVKGDGVIKSLTFRGQKTTFPCVAPTKSPTATPTATATATATASATPTKSASTSPSASRTAGQPAASQSSTEPALPVTGSTIPMVLFMIGAVALVAGAAGILWARRKREVEFEA